MNPILSRYWYVALLLLILAVAGISWANYVYVQENPGGNDFLVHWVGTRSLLIDGISPYSDTVAERIQTLAYGRPARPGEHELRVAYPLYSIVIFLPYALISDYEIARALWMTTLAVALIGLSFVSLNLTKWKMSIWMLPFFLIFSLLWYHSLRPLINGNAVILIALFLAAAVAALRSGRDEFAGILLAISTIKPHLVLLPILFIAIWTISTRRWKVLGWMLITLVFLSVSMALFIPDWPLQNLAEIMRYSSYNPPGTPGAVFELWFPATGRILGWILSASLALLVIVEWYLSREKDFRWKLWTFCLTLVVSQWIGIQTDPGNFILLFLPLVLVLTMLVERWGKSGYWVDVVLLGSLFIFPWAIFLQTIQFADQPMQHPLMFFPLPLFLLISLYWVRWWAIRPRQLMVDELRAYEENI